MKTPLVVIVFPTERAPGSTRFGGFARRLQKAGGLQGCEVVTVALENLAFVIDASGNAKVTDVATGQDIGKADLVYFKSWEAMPEEAAALAHYLQGKGIPFMDTAASGVGISKLASTMRFWAHGIPVPPTLYVRRADRLVQALADHSALLGSRFIVKDIQGAKGKLNFYVTADAVPGILADHPGVQFICQRFIPNDGDYRIGVYVEKSRFVIARTGAGESHLNNTSAGGTARFIPAADMPDDTMRLAEAAAAAVGLQVAGVDIIVDSETKQSYVLEANQGSQIVTGAFVDENIKLFNEGMADAIRNRHARTASGQPLKMLGRRTMVAFPELGITQAVAKVDTGAYSSALHAENIHLEQTADGAPELVFTIAPHDKLLTVDAQPHEVRIARYFTQEIRSSNGNAEHRYSFNTTFDVAGQQFVITLTVSDRATMSCPVLLGRRAIRSRFLVNVELNEGL